MKNDGRKTEQAHWDQAWSSPVRPRVPSRLNVDVRSLTDLLRRKVFKNARYIEIGCAPGKYLAWVDVFCGSKTSGLDYSTSGIKNCQDLFRAMRLDIDLHQGDFFANDLRKSSFDVVTSFGFIEHFDDPTVAIEKHIELLAPGGVALIAIPNYGGLLGKLQGYFDPANLALHNIAIMSPVALLQLVRLRAGVESEAYYYGRPSLWLINFEKKMPKLFALFFQIMANFVGHLFPSRCGNFSPLIVLEVRKDK